MARDLSRARAILIGNGSFEDRWIGALPAAGCVQAVRDLLAGPLCGWPADRITVLNDMPAPDQLARQVITAVRDAQDVDEGSGRSRAVRVCKMQDLVAQVLALLLTPAHAQGAANTHGKSGGVAQ